MNYNWAADAYRSYELAIAALRERGVREGRFTPQNETEAAWARQGPVPVEHLGGTE